jgi:hypothetical protein
MRGRLSFGFGEQFINAPTIPVFLDEADIAAALKVARERQRYNEVNGAADKYGATKGVQLHEIGCLGEYASAKHYRVPWPNEMGLYSAADVGRWLNVRARTQRWHDLIIHDSDIYPCNIPVILAYVGTVWPSKRPGNVELLGYWFPLDTRLRHWKDPAKGRPAFFISQTELMPMWGIAIS